MHRGGPQPPATSIAPAVAVGATQSSSGGVPALLIVALGLALVVLLVAGAPAAALPRPVDALIDPRRESLVFISLGVLLALGVGLLVALGS